MQIIAKRTREFWLVHAALVAAWEERHEPIEAPDPIEAIRAHMTDHGLGQADFARLLGTRSLASDILNRRRALSLGAIRKISTAWSIPADVLIQPYKLTRARAAALRQTRPARRSRPASTS